jgi:F-box protein 11
MMQRSYSGPGISLLRDHAPTSKPPDAFLSYTRFDDQHNCGAITGIRHRLSNGMRAISGEAFEIFQDVDGIGLGERWGDKLAQMLDQARFFIPIITPSYFRSKACREELEKFLRAEAQRGRDDLVLPIYYITCETLEDENLRAHDPLVQTIYERQWYDLRDLRFQELESDEVRQTLERLAREFVRARDTHVSCNPR